VKKVAIIIISLFLLLSAVNFGTSMPVQDNEPISETDPSINDSVVDHVQKQHILQDINRLDGYFTENQGQVGNDSVRYYIQEKGVWFLDDGVVFEIREPINDNEVTREPYNMFHPEYESEMTKPIKNVVLKLNFEGCNIVNPKGIGQLHHRNNYFYGNDSSKWCTNVPNFQEILYENIYNNIDLRYYSNENGLKYDFIVKPGGDPSDIILRYQGGRELYVEDEDCLIIQTSLGIIFDSNLFIYQELKNNINKINGKFKVFDTETYGYEVIGEYDKNEILIIDPLIYSTYVGGNDHDSNEDIVVDLNGSVICTGKTGSTDFPTVPGSYDTSYNGPSSGSDVYIYKLNSNGSALIFSTYVGGSEYDDPRAITVDDYGNTYLTGYTYSTDFPVTVGANDTSSNGMNDLFSLKLNSNGSSLIYSTFIGGNENDAGRGIAVDSEGNAFVVGSTRSLNFPVTNGANDTTYNGQTDITISKLNSNGSILIYSTFLGGSQPDLAEGICIDSNGSAYITGFTESTDFPITANAIDKTYNGGFHDTFILKLNSSGALILYSTYIGGSDRDDGYGIDLDYYNNVYITGYTHSSDFPNTTNAYDTSKNGNSDIFVLSNWFFKFK
jgi:hypothetical protein